MATEAHLSYSGGETQSFDWIFNTETMFDVNNLSLTIPNGTTLLAGLTFTARLGELLAIIGPNGSGKTTLLNTLSGYLPYHTGTIKINGRELRDIPLAERARLMSVISLDDLPYSEFVVMDYVLLGRAPYLGWFGVQNKRDEQIAEESLIMAQADGLKDKKLSQLSSGERQRVELARALTQETPLILLDEPVAHLDLRYQIEMMELFSTLSTAGKCILAVMHDINLVKKYCQKVLAINTQGEAHHGETGEILTAEMTRKIFNLSGEYTF